MTKTFSEEKLGTTSSCVDNTIHLDLDSSDDQIYTVDKSSMFAFTFYILSYTADALFSLHVNNVEILQIATRGNVHVWNSRYNTVYVILKLNAEDKLVFKKIAGSFQDVRLASWIIAENP